MAEKKGATQSNSKQAPSEPKTLLNDATTHSGNNRSNLLEGVKVLIHFQAKTIKGAPLELPQP